MIARPIRVVSDVAAIVGVAGTAVSDGGSDAVGDAGSGVADSVAEGVRLGICVVATRVAVAEGVRVAVSVSVAVLVEGREAVGVRVTVGVRVSVGVRVGVGLAARHWTTLPVISRRVVQPLITRLLPGANDTARTARLRDRTVRRDRTFMDGLSKISVADTTESMPTQHK